MQHPGRPRLAYVEFGDEEAMKAGLEKHAEVRFSFVHHIDPPKTICAQKLKDTIPEVKQATDRESRGEAPHRGGPRGRGRGAGGYAARGFAAAGLTRGHRGSDAGEGARPSPTGAGAGGESA